MKNLFLFLLLFPVFVQAQTTYYISSSYQGSGGKPNGTENRPFTNWSQVPRLLPGDNVLFKRGDIFPLTNPFVVAQSGTPGKRIVIGAYGTGAKPVLSALTPLKNWTSTGNGIWYTSSPAEPVIVVVDGAIYGKGRYPKNAYNIYSFTPPNAASITQFSDPSLAGGPSWVGAEVVVRNGGQTCVYSSVAAQSSDGVVTLSSPVKSPNNNYGYFFRNHLRTLTSVGDWMYNAAEQRIYMYLGANANHTISVARDVEDAVYTMQSYITLQDLTIEGGTGTGIKFKNGKFNVVDSCEIRYCFNGTAVDGGTTAGGFIKEGATDHLYQNNYYHDLTNTGARQITTCPRMTFQNNTFENIGMVLGTGDTGSTSGMGMYLIGDDVTVINNRFFNIGFMPIYFRRNNVLIKNNFINGFSFTKDDTAGIYGWTQGGAEADNTSNRIIQGNIIMNGQSNTGSGNNKPNIRASGIYTDFADNVTITDNIILNVSGYGLFIHQSSSNTVQNNIVYAAGRAGANFEENSRSRRPLQNLDFSNNLILNKGGRLLKVTRKLSAIDSQFGNFANNYYNGSPSNDGDDDNNDLSRSGQQRMKDLDRRSRFESDNGREIRVEYNVTNQPKVINLNSKPYRNLKTGEVVSGKITLQPYGGIALIAQ